MKAAADGPAGAARCRAVRAKRAGHRASLAHERAHLLRAAPLRTMPPGSRRRARASITPTCARRGFCPSRFTTTRTTTIGWSRISAISGACTTRSRWRRTWSSCRGSITGNEAAWRMGRAAAPAARAQSFELWDELTALEASRYLAPRRAPSAKSSGCARSGVAWYEKGDAARGAGKLAGAGAAAEGSARGARQPPPIARKPRRRRPGNPTTKSAKAMAAAHPRLRGAASHELENALAEVRLARAVAAGDLRRAHRACRWCTISAALRHGRGGMLALGDFDAAEKLLRRRSQKDPAQVLPYALLAECRKRRAAPRRRRRTSSCSAERSAELDLDAAGLRPARARSPRACICRPIGARPFSPRRGCGRAPAAGAAWAVSLEPYPAPPLVAAGCGGQTVSLESRKGKPTLVLFYLGAGCPRCIEQLNTIRARREGFCRRLASTSSP